MCIVNLSFHFSYEICFKLQVMNAYIYYLRAQEHLSNRAGGQVWLESTHVSNLMHRDYRTCAHEHEHEHDKVIERALNYLKHDMVTSQYFLITYIFKSKTMDTTYFLCCQLFVPVNANRNHWILLNVDGPNRCIQILDSFGSSMCQQYQLRSHFHLCYHLKGHQTDHYCRRSRIILTT
jgi:hypothetical protein